MAIWAGQILRVRKLKIFDDWELQLVGQVEQTGSMFLRRKKAEHFVSCSRLNCFASSNNTTGKDGPLVHDKPAQRWVYQTRTMYIEYVVWTAVFIIRRKVKRCLTGVSSSIPEGFSGLRRSDRNILDTQFGSRKRFEASTDREKRDS